MADEPPHSSGVLWSAGSSGVYRPLPMCSLCGAVAGALRTGPYLGRPPRTRGRVTVFGRLLPRRASGGSSKVGETPMRVVVAVVAVFGLAAHAAPVGETRQLQTAGYGIGGVPGISPSAKTDYAVQRGQLMKWRAHMRDWYCAKEQTDKFKNEKTFPCMIQTYLNQVKAETSEADKKEMVEEHKRYMQSVKAAAPVLPKHPCRRAGGSTNHPHFGRPARAGRRDNEEAACAGVLGHVQCVLR